LALAAGMGPAGEEGDLPPPEDPPPWLVHLGRILPGRRAFNRDRQGLPMLKVTSPSFSFSSSSLSAFSSGAGGSEPHLHIAQRPGSDDAPFGGEHLPLTIEGRYLVRNDRIKGRRW
jgi:hypothetical protein